MRGMTNVWRGLALVAGVVLFLCASPARAQSCPTTWSDSFASGDMNNSVRSMVIWNGQVYAAGLFSHAGGTTARYVARWDGRSWHPIGDGFNSYVYTLCVFNNELYAGGIFTMSGTTNTRYVAKWNGSAWEPVGVGFNSGVNALAVYNNELYVAV